MRFVEIDFARSTAFQQLVIALSVSLASLAPPDAETVKARHENHFGELDRQVEIEGLQEWAKAILESVNPEESYCFYANN